MNFDFFSTINVSPLRTGKIDVFLGEKCVTEFSKLTHFKLAQKLYLNKISKNKLQI
jgi:hypothetical protein